MKKEKIGFSLLCVSYALYYLTMGIYTPYLNVYYERIGLTGSQIGLINSIGLLLAMIISPIWGALTDRNNRYKTMISLLLILTGITGIIWHQQRIFIYIFIVSLFLNVFRSNIGNIYDGFSIAYCKQNNHEYSFVRSMGSLGYLIGAFVIGNIMFEKFQIQGPYMKILLIASIIASFLLIFVKSPSFPKVNKETNNFKDNMKHLFHNRDFIFILFLTFFSIHLFDSANNYMGNHLVATLHLMDSSIGLITLAMVLPEILIVMKIHVLIQKWGLKKSFILAIVCQIFRCFIYATSSSFVLIMLVSVVHGVMIGVGTVGVVSYIHQKVPSYMLATAMTLYGAFIVIAYALQAQLFGIVYQIFGSHMIFVITLLLTCVALVMAIKTNRLDE